MKKFYFTFLCSLFCLSFYSSAQEAEMPAAGDTRTDEKGIEQVYVSSGCFMMGTSETEAEYARSLDAPSWAVGRISSE